MFYRLSTLLNFFILFFTFNISAWAQDHNAQFDNITIENGLSSSSVQSICQDSSGYIWIGTRDGLNKFDGINFIVYNHIPGDSSSLSDNYIYRLLVDKSQNLLVGTLGGLNIFDPGTNKFQLIRLANSSEKMEIGFLTIDPENNIWVSTNTPSGVFIISGLTGKFSSGQRLKYISTFFPLPDIHADALKPEYVQAIFFKNKLEAWIGTNYNLYKVLFTKNNFGKEPFQFKKFTCDPGKKNSLSNSFVNDITEDNYGTIWVDYYYGGIDRIITSIQNTFERDSIIPFFPKSSINKPIEILNSLKDHSGNIWFGTKKDGVYKIQPTPVSIQLDSTKFIDFRNLPNNPKSLLSNQCNTLFEDKSGLIWMGTETGISVYNRNKDNLNITGGNFFKGNSSFSVTAILNDSQYLWIGTDDLGLAALNKRNNNIFYVSSQASSRKSLSDNMICSILKDHLGNMWIGTANGLNYLDEKEIKAKLVVESDNSLKPDIKKILSSDNNPNTISGKIVFALLEDDENILWIGTNNGIDCLNPGDFRIVKKIKVDKLKNTCLSSKIVSCLFMDHQHHIWVGTNDGLNEVDKKTGRITKYYNNGEDLNSLSSNRISAVYQTNDDVYWIGTDGGGLNRFDKSKNIFKRYTTQNGLSNNVIQAIEDDHNGNLWLSTNNGLTRLNMRDSSFTYYNVNDGLKSNGFNPRASYKSPDGELFFGSTNGFNSFYPERITKNTFIPPIVITDFKIFDKSVFGPGFGNTKSTLLNNSFVQLDYNQNFFSFEFAALNYINSSKNQYKYKLDGVDANWILAGNRRFASYTNIDPGTYLFHVTGSNNDGVWNEKGIAITIKIIPPYYKTWWFRTIMAFVIATLIFFITQTRIKAIRQTKEKEVIEHSARMKEQFLANMSHEIRTPMNAIVGMTRLLIEKEPRGDQKKYLNAIEQSSDNLLVIINDILDFSKIEAGKLELEYIPFSISALLDGVYSTMQFKIKEKGLQLSCEVAADVPAAVSGDRVRLNEVFLNLVGNAVKFTHHGNIKVSCVNRGNCVDNNGTAVPNRVNIEFSVSDTGIGIPEDRLEFIFESFSQASSDTTRKFGGTGLGLTISKHLVELHGGKISVKSKPGFGTVFTFNIPYEIADSSLIEKEKTTNQKTYMHLHKLKLLLAEDNEFNQLVAVDTLQSHIPGISIDIANNGKEAFEKTESGNYDLILMDIQMPEMDGYTATQLIRSQLLPPKNKIKIMAMTAGALKSEIQKCFDAGMDDYISKPFDPQLLIEKMSTLFPDQEANMA